MACPRCTSTIVESKHDAGSAQVQVRGEPKIAGNGLLGEVFNACHK